jgi:hypothetical protein
MNKLSRHYFIATILLLSVVFGAPPLHAADGQLEINQACAVNTGCFPGDVPGFPVTIIQPGSYRLTGNLDLSAEGVNVSGVAVSAPAVTIELAGFQIAGPTSCSGSGSIISCNPSSTGVGSAGVQFTIDATAGVVQNGIVRNMTNFGIFSQATGLRVQDITAVHNGRDGIAGREGSLVVNSVAIENGQDGIDINTGSVVDGVTAIGNGSNGIRGQGSGSVVTRTSVRHNGMRGFFLGLQYKFGKDNVSSGNGEPDGCGGGICTERRRFYRSRTIHNGANALSGCPAIGGFKMASFEDLLGAAHLDYDPILGVPSGDDRDGIPQGVTAWLQSGSQAGRGVNCNGWTTAADDGIQFQGREANFDNYITIPEASALTEYRAMVKHLSCSAERRVWCVEVLNRR